MVFESASFWVLSFLVWNGWSLFYGCFKKFLSPHSHIPFFRATCFSKKNIIFNIPFHYMIQIDRAGTKSFHTAGLFSGKNIVFNILPLLGSKYEDFLQPCLWDVGVVKVDICICCLLLLCAAVV